MDVSILVVPYRLGHKSDGTGAGPQRLVNAGAAAAVSSTGHPIRRTQVVRSDHDTGHEVGNVLVTLRALADEVRSARKEGTFPMVLAGDCNSTIGVIAGLGNEGIRRGIVWFDAHGDVNTPDITESGYFDGMPLALIMGWCWPVLAGSLPGFAPIHEELVLHVGGRAFDDRELSAISKSRVNVVNAATLSAPDGQRKMTEALQRLAAVTDGIHVHVDLDVINKSDGVASKYADALGPPLQDLETAIRTIGKLCRIQSATFCSYDPNFDHDARAAGAGVRLINALAAVLPD